MTSPSASESIATVSSESARLRGFALASVLGALMLSLFLEALDQAIVGTALPRIIATLHGLDRYTWVVTAYVLATATMVPIVGKVSDQFGRKWFLVSGTVLFLIGSALAGMSQTMNQLIAFRAVQGLGAGIGIALVATVIGDLFPPDQRGKLMGLFGMVYGVSSLLGPTLGGYFAEHGPLLGNIVTESTRWRWVFYFNLPIGAVAVVALVIFLPANLSVRTESVASWAAMRRIDIAGAALSAAATIFLLLGLTLVSDHSTRGATSGAVTLLVIGALLFGLFVRVEHRAKDPILPLDLFRNQVFTASAALGLLQMMVMMGLTIYLALFLQSALSISPTTAGLVMTSLTLAMVAGAVVSGAVISAIKRYQVIAVSGAALMVVGAILVATMTTRTSLAQAIVYMIVIGLGTGVFFAVPPTAAQNALPASRLGIGTAATRYMGQVGASLGIAIVGSVVNSGISPELLRRVPTTLAGKQALAAALQHGFVAMLVFAVLTLVATAFLKDLPMVSAQKTESEGTEEPERELSIA